MNTYAYKITDMQRDQNGIVIAASFEILCSDGVDTFTYIGYTAFTKPPVNPVPFAQLTQQDVIGWIKGLLGKNPEDQADIELAALKSSKTTLLGTPW